MPAYAANKVTGAPASSVPVKWGELGKGSRPILSASKKDTADARGLATGVYGLPYTPVI